jgi:hypothetical protein
MEILVWSNNKPIKTITKDGFQGPKVPARLSFIGGRSLFGPIRLSFVQSPGKFVCNGLFRLQRLA